MSQYSRALDVIDDGSDINNISQLNDRPKLSFDTGIRFQYGTTTILSPNRPPEFPFIDIQGLSPKINNTYYYEVKNVIKDLTPPRIEKYRSPKTGSTMTTYIDIMNERIMTQDNFTLTSLLDTPQFISGCVYRTMTKPEFTEVSFSVDGIYEIMIFEPRRVLVVYYNQINDRIVYDVKSEYQKSLIGVPSEVTLFNTQIISLDLDGSNKPSKTDQTPHLTPPDEIPLLDDPPTPIPPPASLPPSQVPTIDGEEHVQVTQSTESMEQNQPNQGPSESIVKTVSLRELQRLYQLEKDIGETKACSCCSEEKNEPPCIEVFQ